MQKVSPTHCQVQLLRHVSGVHMGQQMSGRAVSTCPIALSGPEKQSGHLLCFLVFSMISFEASGQEKNMGVSFEFPRLTIIMTPRCRSNRGVTRHADLCPSIEVFSSWSVLFHSPIVHRDFFAVSSPSLIVLQLRVLPLFIPLIFSPSQSQLTCGCRKTPAAPPDRLFCAFPLLGDVSGCFILSLFAHSRLQKTCPHFLPDNLRSHP